MRKAIIVGCPGQDGTLLYQLLKKHHYQIIGIGRNSTQIHKVQLPIHKVDICDPKEVSSLISVFQPDEIYYLAAYHHSAEDNLSESSDLWQQSYQVNTQSFLFFLEAIRLYSPHTRIFYAASSHIFGQPPFEPQDETTPVNPISIYGITKAMGFFISKYYRATFGVFASVGILYNHESIYRSEKFVSAKIINSALRIRKFEQEKLIIGDLSTLTDWGYAPDYVLAMMKILALPDPDDFIIATGETHSVQDFIEIVFQELNLDWMKYVEEQDAIITRHMTHLIGNSNKLRDLTGWRPSVSFHEMVRLFVHRKLKLVSEEGLHERN